ncbi:diguanylate cyclase [Synechocystis sp. LKSZ1]|uniref:diguanylate cyclase n=1 Tax=Synechocystis sp. LKSZ1 TaxID=3144951 RepID=UPI00336C0FCC
MTFLTPDTDIDLSTALDHIEKLEQENRALLQENQDLHIALSTIAEHGDMIEALLNDTNVKLKAEIAEKQRAEAKLQSLLSLISRQKEDLEIMVETIMQHGDVVDAQWREKLCETVELANLDALTQIANRRRFDDHLHEQWQTLGAEQQPLALILCDIDHFKQFNDFYGHLSGDDCLRRVAQALSASLRNPYDLFARYGGEEFAALLPYTDKAGAGHTAKRMQATLNLLEIPHHPSPIAGHVTMSFGIAITVPQATVDPLSLVAMADHCLYQAKQQGKNCIVCTQSPTPY